MRGGGAGEENKGRAGNAVNACFGYYGKGSSGSARRRGGGVGGGAGEREEGVGEGPLHLYRDHLFHLKTNKNTDRACRQTRAQAAEDFTGLTDAVPRSAGSTSAGSRSAGRALPQALGRFYSSEGGKLTPDGRQNAAASAEL